MDLREISQDPRCDSDLTKILVKVMILTDLQDLAGSLSISRIILQHP